MDVDHCDFKGWTERDMQIERINPDVEFWELALIKAKKFFSLCIRPELIGKWYTQPSTPPTWLHGDDELVDDVDGDEEEGPWCNLVPRAHVPFGQHQDTELWNNQKARSQSPRVFCF